MLLYPLTNFEIQKYYQNEPRFNGIHSRHNLPKTKDVAYVINLDEYMLIGINLITLDVNDNVTQFDSLEVEYIPKEIKKFIVNRNITTNIFRIQAYDSIMCRYFCIVFIDYIVES